MVDTQACRQPMPLPKYPVSYRRIVRRDGLMRRKLLNRCVLALPLDADAPALLHKPFPVWLIASQQYLLQNYAALDLTILVRMGCSVRGRTKYRIGRSAGLELAITGLVTAGASIPYPRSRSRGPSIRKPNSTWKKTFWPSGRVPAPGDRTRNVAARIRYASTPHPAKQNYRLT
jgi:hypothetical protein